MLKIINKPEDKQGIIKMSDMLVNAIAKIVSNNKYNGHYIIKIHKHCYFNLTNGFYWEDGDVSFVQLLPPGEKIIVEFFNEE